MKRLLIPFLLFCSVAHSQPRKQSPAPFNATMSAYTQGNCQDTLLNKFPLEITNVLGTDSVTTAQTLQPVLSVTLPANATYAIDIYVQDSSSTTAGNQYGISVPSGATISGKAFGSLSTTTFTTDDITASNTAGAAYTTTVPTTNLGFWWAHVTITTTTGGAVTVKQLKATSGTAIAKANSTYIVATRKTNY